MWGSLIIHDEDQDTTDLQKCLSLVWEQEQKTNSKYRTILVAGGFGGSFSHEMANCHTLLEHVDRHIVLWSNLNIAWLLKPGSHKIICKAGIKCGIIPLGSKCESITTTGLKWNLDNHPLNFGDLISTSNVTANDIVELSVSHAVLWTIDFVNE